MLHCAQSLHFVVYKAQVENYFCANACEPQWTKKYIPIVFTQFDGHYLLLSAESTLNLTLFNLISIRLCVLSVIYWKYWKRYHLQLILDAVVMLLPCTRLVNVLSHRGCIKVFWKRPRAKSAVYAIYSSYFLICHNSKVLDFLLLYTSVCLKPFTNFCWLSYSMFHVYLFHVYYSKRALSQ